MSIPTDMHRYDVYDEDPAFVRAVSLLAALEGAAGREQRPDVLPFLGMARAELTDFGQRRTAHYVAIDLDVLGDLADGLVTLEDELMCLLADSQRLQHSLRLDAALQLLRRAIAAATLSAGTQEAD